MAPRDKAQRKADVLGKLTAPAADVWVATASDDGPYLVPLSLAWIDERVVIALEGTSRTARGIEAQGRARLGLGPTRDVVLIDAMLERTESAGEPGKIAEAYAAQADWDPREAGDGYVYLVLRPERIPAWRESDELPGRLLMRSGQWLI